MPSLFHMISIQGRESYWGDSMAYAFNIGLRLYAYKPISFKDSVVFLSCSLVKKHADLFGSFLY